MEQNVILEVKNLSVSSRSGTRKKFLLNDLNFKIYKGQIVGLVGETGSGKTLTMLSVINMLSSNIKIESGQIIFMSKDITPNNGNNYNHFTDGISMIFQNQHLSLSPIFKISTQMQDIIKANKNLKGKQIKEYCYDLLKDVGFEKPQEIYNKYPFELSGGMMQRVVLALAVSMEPKLLIADEPTTALDPEMQNYCLWLLYKFNKKLNNTIILVTHDFSVVKKICTDVIVMKDGKIIEKNTVKNILQNPNNKYTKDLISSI